MIKKHLRYLTYVLKHKWFVFLECCKMGIPIRGLLHDMSKFRPSEWSAYAEHFYGAHGRKVRDSTGYYNPCNTGDADFDEAWFWHQKRNKHHWQYWVMPRDKNGVVIRPMSHKSRKEMLCDWKGAGRAQRRGQPGEVLDWYIKNRHKLRLHVETRGWVEKQLGLKWDPHR